ncbi:two-partner secretion domain-containing protein [Merismopedia glauca]|uniref:Filamentous haemagglutinin FhaB/tRNA nuclease CdiA-like TPS domain-containing protein n=1 Tax=Merismopedia glauca CCAP 1448/3 TaxID=1296344 RepID=A0A2T1C8H1_9CYAN|nr:filamentous hemagglutinin N-terminal domain-containing protein [Merismopedia glauca]PSB04570.1 hypothetical protein C7B64_03155 [Merismopedia glauca CCAP 1448/3]
MKRTTSVLPSLLVGFFLVSFYPVDRVVAQITHDDTLGSEHSKIENNGNLINITGGAIRGKNRTNLFHSFDKFNIPSDSTADFRPESGIKTIFSRVTGTDPSIILGTLKVRGGANLFFMNPRGIVFGSGAKLDTQGAFVATTANSIKFPDGTHFSTINPQGAPLLTIETPTPIGLEFVGGSPGAIINAADLLSKDKDSTISLIGGTVINTGTISTIKIIEDAGEIEGNGDINLITVPSGVNSVVKVDNHGIFIPSLTTSPPTLTPTTVSGLPLQDLVQQAGLSSDLIPLIQSRDIQPGDIFIDSSSGTFPFTLATGDSGSLLLHSSRNLNLMNTWIVSIDNTKVDSDINLAAKGDINLINSQIQALPFKYGSISDINLNANNISLTADNPKTSEISTNSVPGKNGDIKLTAINQIILDNQAKVFTDNSNERSKSGKIALDANEILLKNGSHVYSGNRFDGTSPGNIKLFSLKIELSQNSLIDTIGKSGNDSGNIFLKVDDLNLDAQSSISALGNLKIKSTKNDLDIIDNKISLTNNSKLLTHGIDGIINIETGIFKIDGGSQVISIQGANVIIDAKDSVTVSGFENGDRSRLGTDNVSLPDPTKAGNLTIITNKLTIQDQGQVSTEGASNSKAGDLTINANSIHLINQGEITANALGKGNSGVIDIDAKDLIELNNGKITSTIITNPDSSGNSGTIDIETPHLSLSNGSVISTEVNSGSIANNPSNIDIKVTNLDLNNSNITASTSGNGDAGEIKITTGDRINLQNNSLISTSVNSGATGQGGKIDISANNLDLNNSNITASTSGIGNAGDIKITTGDRINLQNNSLISTSVNPGAIGQGGKIEIFAKTLDVGSGSRFTTTTESQKNAGDISLHISDKITLDSSGSGLFANTGKDSDGNGGNISIDPKVFLIQNGAGVFVDSQGTGSGGNIEISASNLTLNNGKISAETLSNNGGDIKLNIAGLLFLQNHSKISTTAGKNEASGNGGNINIEANFVVTNPFGDNDITANAFTGNGGNINIAANGIFGFEIQDNFRFNLANSSLENNRISEIVASSQFGFQGNIEISTLQIDPLAGLETLPETTVNVQVSQGCNTRSNRTKIEYFYLGKTGLPNNPEQLFSEEVTPAWTSWSNSNQNSESKTRSNSAQSRLASSTSNTISGALPCQQGH